MRHATPTPSLTEQTVNANRVTILLMGYVMSVRLINSGTQISRSVDPNAVKTLGSMEMDVYVLMGLISSMECVMPVPMGNTLIRVNAITIALTMNSGMGQRVYASMGTTCSTEYVTLVKLIVSGMEALVSATKGTMRSTVNV